MAGTAADAALEDNVRRIVEEERAHGGTPAMSVVAVRNGRVVVEIASGLADKETGRAATLETQYPAGSVSKVLTAVLVMRQVEEGRLNLDEPVNMYLEPKLWVRDRTGKPVPVTLRQLLSHNSGMPVTWKGIIDLGDQVRTIEEHLADGQRILHSPGERVVYSNNGFALAGYVAAKVAGQSFSDYARHTLFEPLGMSRSTFQSPWQFEDALAAAYGHWFEGGSDRNHHADATAIAPAGALITTARDLARFALMILGEGEFDGVRVLQPQSVAEMMRLQARPHPDMDQGFGLGFAVRERHGRHLAWWDGSLSGAAARLTLLPDAKAGVVVLSNLANNEASSVAGRRILDALVQPPSVSVYEPLAEDLNGLAGLYRPLDFVDPEYWYLNYLMAFEIKRRGDRLVQKSLITGERTLSPIGPNRFRITGSMFDDSTVLFDGDTMFLGYLSAKRIPVWQSPIALVIYAVFVVLTVFSLLGWWAWRAVRRPRQSRAAIHQS
ncbi:serine hydrolase domain-containing protein [Hoeflea sp. TYP-13]|uniref:serine hydrolase domain-containing protein n=1 Tax=Hoeflea sp. TYP-13 TaxID=3230023 RepID=UPI0034C5F34A